MPGPAFARLPVGARVLLEKANSCGLGTKCFASCEWIVAAGAHRVQNPLSEMDAQQVLTLLLWTELLSQHSSMISVAQIVFYRFGKLVSKLFCSSSYGTRRNTGYRAKQTHTLSAR